MENVPLVSIICLAFNHEEYIAEALNGLVSQETNFDIEIIVHDDASSDNTAKIIRDFERSYPNLFNNIYQVENQYSKERGRVSNIVYSKASGKYIAFCEGDDYWIDSGKLQKQVDYLEENENSVLVYTDSYYLNNNTGEKVLRRTQQVNGLSDLLIRNQIWTLTTCIRKDIIDDFRLNYLNEFKEFPFGDYPLWLFAAMKGDLKYMNNVTSVYRVLEESASHSKDPIKLVNIAKKVYQCKMKFISVFKVFDTTDIKNKIKGVEVFTQVNIAVKFCDKRIYNSLRDQITYIKFYNKKYFYLLALSKINFTFFCYCYNFILKVRNKIIKL